MTFVIEVWSEEVIDYRIDLHQCLRIQLQYQSFLLCARVLLPSLSLIHVLNTFLSLIH